MSRYHQIKPENLGRVIVLVLLSIGWRISIGNDVTFIARDPYIFPIVGCTLTCIILGELSRRIFRLIFKYPEKKMSHVIVYSKRETNVMEGKKDIEALNFGIIWGLVAVIFSYY